jgi:ribosomal protein S2
MNKNIMTILLSFGVHIGDLYIYKHYHSELNYYLFCIRNDFFVFNLRKSIFFFKRALNFIFLAAHSFCKILFYHSYINSTDNFKFILAYLIKYKGGHSIVNNYWIPGLISNYKMCFRKLLYVFLRVEGKAKLRNKYRRVKSSMYYRKNGTFLRYIFLKLLYFTYKKTNLQRDWFTEFHKLWLFWRVYLFLRGFKDIFDLPDILILINPDDAFYRATEFSKTHKLPVICTIDSASSWYGVTYPIPSNDDSIPLSIFYFSIFVNVYMNAKILNYKKIYKFY